MANDTFGAFLRTASYEPNQREIQRLRIALELIGRITEYGEPGPDLKTIELIVKTALEIQDGGS